MQQLIKNKSILFLLTLALLQGCGGGSSDSGNGNGGGNNGGGNNSGGSTGGGNSSAQTSPSDIARDRPTENTRTTSALSQAQLADEGIVPIALTAHSVNPGIIQLDWEDQLEPTISYRVYWNEGKANVTGDMSFIDSHENTYLYPSAVANTDYQFQIGVWQGGEEISRSSLLTFSTDQAALLVD